MNGPTELRRAREERQRYVTTLLRERDAAEARVAVLEQQTAAIKAAVDRVGLSDSNRIANVHVILAAGVDPKGSMVVDNPTEPKEN